MYLKVTRKSKNQKVKISETYFIFSNLQSDTSRQSRRRASSDPGKELFRKQNGFLVRRLESGRHSLGQSPGRNSEGVGRRNVSRRRLLDGLRRFPEIFSGFSFFSSAEINNPTIFENKYSNKVCSI